MQDDATGSPSHRDGGLHVPALGAEGGRLEHAGRGSKSGRSRSRVAHSVQAGNQLLARASRPERSGRALSGLKSCHFERMQSCEGG